MNPPEAAGTIAAPTDPWSRDDGTLLSRPQERRSASTASPEQLALPDKLDHRDPSIAA